MQLVIKDQEKIGGEIIEDIQKISEDSVSLTKEVVNDIEKIIIKRCYSDTTLSYIK